MRSGINARSYHLERKCAVAIAAAGLELLSTAAAAGQTRIDLSSQSRNPVFSTPVTFGASGPGVWAFRIPGGSAPAAPASGSFWVANGRLWWHNGSKAVSFVSDDGSGSGAVAWNTLANPAANLVLNTNGYSTTLSLGATQGTAHGLRISDGAGNTGTGIIGHFSSGYGSRMTPWQADASGTGWQVDAGGQLRAVGSAESGAITLSGSISGACTLSVPPTGGALEPGAAAECDVGSAALPIASLYLAGNSPSPGSASFKLTGTATESRTWTLPDASDVFVGRRTADILTNKTLDTASNTLNINGVTITGAQGSSGTALMAGTVSGAGAPLCTDASGNATTSGCPAGGAGVTILKAADYTVAAGDSGLLLSMTGTHTFSLPAAGAPGFGANWMVRLQNGGSGTVTVSASGSAFYGGGYSGSTLTLAAGQSIAAVSDGSNWSVANDAPGSNQNVRTIGVTFDGGGAALTGSLSRCAPVHFAGAIQQATVISDAAGSATVDVSTAPYASYSGPASAASITASSKPALSGSSKYQDSALAGWNTALAANTMVCFALSNPSGVSWVTANLKVAAQ